MYQMDEQRPKRRQTRIVPHLKRKKRGRGRPKGTHRRFKFEETRIGFMLRYEMTMVYHLLRQLCGKQSPFEPDWRVIDSVARASKDISYKKPKFKRYLDEYREKGLYCSRGRELTPKRKTYYESIRKHKSEEYIRINRRIIKARLREGETGEELLEEVKNIIKTKE